MVDLRKNSRKTPDIESSKEKLLRLKQQSAKQAAVQKSVNERRVAVLKELQALQEAGKTPQQKPPVPPKPVRVLPPEGTKAPGLRKTSSTATLQPSGTLMDELKAAQKKRLGSVSLSEESGTDTRTKVLGNVSSGESFSDNKVQAITPQISRFVQDIKGAHSRVLANHIERGLDSKTELSCRGAAITDGFTPFIKGVSLDEGLSIFKADDIERLKNSANRTLDSLKDAKKLDQEEIENFEAFVHNLNFLERFIATEGRIPETEARKIFDAYKFKEKIDNNGTVEREGFEKILKKAGKADDEYKARAINSLSKEELFSLWRDYLPNLYDKDFQPHRDAALSNPAVQKVAKDFLSLSESVLSNPRNKPQFYDRSNALLHSQLMAQYGGEHKPGETQLQKDSIDESRKAVEGILTKYQTYWKSTPENKMTSIEKQSLSLKDKEKQDFSDLPSLLEQKVIRSGIAKQSPEELIRVYNDLNLHPAQDKNLQKEVAATKKMVVSQMMNSLHDLKKPTKGTSKTEQNKGSYKSFESAILQNVELQDLESYTPSKLDKNKQVKENIVNKLKKDKPKVKKQAKDKTKSFGVEPFVEQGAKEKLQNVVKTLSAPDKSHVPAPQAKKGKFTILAKAFKTLRSGVFGGR